MMRQEIVVRWGVVIFFNLKRKCASGRKWGLGHLDSKRLGYTTAFWRAKQMVRKWQIEKNKRIILLLMFSLIFSKERDGLERQGWGCQKRSSFVREGQRPPGRHSSLSHTPIRLLSIFSPDGLSLIHSQELPLCSSSEKLLNSYYYYYFLPLLHS